MVQSLIKILNHRSTHSEDISPDLCEGGDISRLEGFCLFVWLVYFVFPLTLLGTAIFHLNKLLQAREGMELDQNVKGLDTDRACTVS